MDNCSTERPELNKTKWFSLSKVMVKKRKSTGKMSRSTSNNREKCLPCCRKVRWAKYDSIYKIPVVEATSKEKLWYQLDEIKRIHFENQNLLAEFFESPFSRRCMASVEKFALRLDHSFRGLEKYELASARGRSGMVTLSRSAVIDAQRNGAGEEEIANSYMKFTKLHFDVARLRAIEDEKFCRQFEANRSKQPSETTSKLPSMSRKVAKTYEHSTQGSNLDTSSDCLLVTSS